MAAAARRFAWSVWCLGALLSPVGDALVPAYPLPAAGHARTPAAASRRFPVRATATRLPRVETAAPAALPTPTAYAAAGGTGWCLGRETVERAVAAIRRGRPVIVTDDADRENEGDLIFAAAHATPETMAFVVRHTSGVVCVALPGDRLDRLELGPMVSNNEDPKGTAFSVSVDLRGHPMTTGISASDRARTLRALADPTAGPRAFCRPGHVFPLRARPGGVLERGGHTEAAVDLAVLAGLAPAGALCEIVRDADGEMSRWDDLATFAVDHDLVLTTIADLQEYRRVTEPGLAGAPPPRHYPDAPGADVNRVARTRMPTSRGEFQAVCYADRGANVEHLALLKGDVGTAAGVDGSAARAAAPENGGATADPSTGPPLVRIHSECATGDIFGSRRCDCGEQLDIALRDVQAAGRGVVLYVRGHEGRGIGLAAKLAAYELQDAGRDTVDANVDLGHPVDARSYAAAAAILLDLGLDEVRLMTNNPAKCAALEDAGITVAERVPIHTAPNADNVAYLRTKQKRMGHLLNLPDEDEDEAP